MASIQRVIDALVMAAEGAKKEFIHMVVGGVAARSFDKKSRHADADHGITNHAKAGWQRPIHLAEPRSPRYPRSRSDVRAANPIGVSNGAWRFPAA